MELHQDAAHLVLHFIAQACRCRPADLHRDSSILELGINSLTLASIAAEVEAECDGEFPERDLQKLLVSRTVGELIDVAQTLLARR